MGNSDSRPTLYVPSEVVLFMEDCKRVPFGKTNLSLRRWLWSDEAVDAHFLESCHNFVQYILPTDTISEFVAQAPTVSQNDVLRSESSFAMLDSIVKSATLMLSFWGIRLVHFQVPTTATDAWSVYKPLAQYAWSLTLSEYARPALSNIAKHGHNVLRMTRLVKCLRLFGLRSLAMEALLLLNEILKMIDQVQENEAAHTSVYTIEDDKSTQQITVFSNKFLADEFLLLRNNTELPDDAERLYFMTVSNVQQFDLLDFATHVQKLWATN